MGFRQINLRLIVPIKRRGIEALDLEILELNQQSHQRIGEDAGISIHRVGLFRRGDRCRGSDPILAEVFIGEGLR